MSDFYPILVVRLTTSTYLDKKGRFCINKVLTPLKRKSNFNFNDIIDDIEYDLPLNLYQVEDGLYTFEYSNISVDYETGIADSWDFVLKPYEQ